MEVTVDNVWATPSTLHVRVTVWGDRYQWRHKYDCAVPTAEIPEEAVRAWTDTIGPGRLSHDAEQLPLF